MENPQNPEQPYLSVVLPVFNEEGGLTELHRRLTDALESMGKSYELVFVDDGSKDRSFEILKELHEADRRVKVVKFSRNFGHHLALTAGMDHTSGEVVVLMDSDLQDQPEEIPRLHQRLDEGYDVVYAVRRNKKHSALKRINSFLFHNTMSRILRFEIQGGVFRMLRRPVVDAVNSCRENDRLVVGLINWMGFRQTGIEVEHGERFAGETKYTLSKQMALALNTITAFSTMPLQAAHWAGGACCLLGLLGAVLTILIGLFSSDSISLIALTLWAVVFVGGIQLVCLGILGEYVGRILTEARSRPLYVTDVVLT